ncbi:MAG: fatty-acid synthase [Shackletoniella antarctica]|uniref:Fatty-acid synthase n=1 Tax=Shackletoniella antarctica TaxID=268115 RepID=A0A2W4W5J8_9CYAN|nr:MAG: fatty-acid synthase [Shackletoniella antarctica]
MHYAVRQALVKDGWSITNDPYVISYGEHFLFIDLGAAETLGDNGVESRFIGAQRGVSQIAVEVKEFRRASAIADLEQAIGQYVLYRLLLNQVDPDRELYLAIGEATFAEIFNEPIGELVIRELPLNLLIVDVERSEVKQWIPPRQIETL